MIGTIALGIASLYCVCCGCIGCCQSADPPDAGDLDALLTPRAEDLPAPLQRQYSGYSPAAIVRHHAIRERAAARQQSQEPQQPTCGSSPTCIMSQEFESFQLAETSCLLQAPAPGRPCPSCQSTFGVTGCALLHEIVARWPGASWWRERQP